MIIVNFTIKTERDIRENINRSGTLFCLVTCRDYGATLYEICHNYLSNKIFIFEHIHFFLFFWYSSPGVVDILYTIVYNGLLRETITSNAENELVEECVRG